MSLSRRSLLHRVWVGLACATAAASAFLLIRAITEGGPRWWLGAVTAVLATGWCFAMARRSRPNPAHPFGRPRSPLVLWIALALPVLVGGTWLYLLSWEDAYTGTSAGFAIADAAYHAARLFTLNLDPPPAAFAEQHVGAWMGGTWRASLFWLVAALAPMLLLGGLAVALQTVARRVNLWFRRDHLVVCGAGEQGLAFLRRSRDDERTDRKSYARSLFSKRPVVVDADPERRAAVEALGADFVAGDPAGPAGRAAARMSRASVVVVVTGDEHADRAIAFAVAADLAARRQRLLPKAKSLLADVVIALRAEVERRRHATDDDPERPANGGSRPARSLRVFYFAGHAAVPSSAYPIVVHPFDLELLVAEAVADAVTGAAAGAPGASGDDGSAPPDDRLVLVAGGDASAARKIVLALGRRERAAGLTIRIVGPNANTLRDELAATRAAQHLALDATDCPVTGLGEWQPREDLLRAVIGAAACGRVVVATGDDDCTRQAAGLLREHPDLAGARVDEVRTSDVGSQQDAVFSLEDAASAPALCAAADRREQALAPLVTPPCDGFHIEYGVVAATAPSLVPFIRALRAPDATAEKLWAENLGVTRVTTAAGWRALAHHLARADPYLEFSAWCGFVHALRLDRAPTPAAGLAQLAEARRKLEEEADRPGARRVRMLLLLAQYIWDDGGRDELRAPLVKLAGLQAASEPWPDTAHPPIFIAGLTCFDGERRARDDAHVEAVRVILEAALAPRFGLKEDALPAEQADLISPAGGFAFRQVLPPELSAAEALVIGPATAVGTGKALDDALGTLSGTRALRFVPSKQCLGASSPPPADELTTIAVEDATRSCDPPEHCDCFSIQQPLAAWTAAVLASGKPQELVRRATLLAFVAAQRLTPDAAGLPSHGRITIQEVLLARALGVSRLAWVDMDPEGHRVRSVEAVVPAPVAPVVPLISDRMTVRAWLRQIEPDDPRLDGPLAVPDDQRPSRDEVDELAERLHDVYVRREARQRAADDPSLKPWRELTDPLKASNRAQARDWANKRVGVPAECLDALLRLAAESADEEALARRLAHNPAVESGHSRPGREDERERADRLAMIASLELLAEMEHGRFVSERILSGWRAGDRAIALKQTPSIVSWEHLHLNSPESPERDRDAVRTCLLWEAERRNRDPAPEAPFAGGDADPA